ncbi:hypothetical protein Tco_1147958, partial [Tanacetum coccineum]
KIWYDEDILDLRSIETEFTAIVFNDNLTSNETPSCEPTISSLNNNESVFKISFDESDDEVYTVIFDKNSFSYKIISNNDLKTDSENDNEKVNKPIFPSPEPTVSCINDLDFFKDFENEFPAIVYNDALTSKSDFSTEPTLCPQHIDKFDLKDETSLSEYDEKEQNVLYFNDLFPFQHRASVSVMPLSTYLNLGLGELAHTKLIVELADRTVKYPKGIIENVLVERMELDLEARLMGETLVLNRLLDPFFKDYIELNDLNVPLELRRDQVDDLMPTIEEGEVIEEFRARNDARMVSKIFGYPSDCDYDKKIRIDCAYNLKFSCMIDVGINAKRFEGIIIIHNGNEEVTYQMARSHPRFKHHTNKQCNKIPPLLKVNKEDKMNGISHSYQKLKGFYKGVLNLGPEYVRDAKMEEWLTRGHISVHEME